MDEIFVEAFVEEELKEEEKFEKSFAEAVYDGLSWISSLVAPVLRIYLKDAMTLEIGLRHHKLTVKDAKNLEKGLEKAFGFGAKVFEKRILESLYVKLGLDEEIREDFRFSKEIMRAKKLYELQVEEKKRE